ncbi:restriction endonuclease subunit S [Dolichospermum sp. UHCC 0684]|jgi:type I restriction enzyme S subunit|uniref:restriction endonuclease subunit S n=1 Tax=unclassified Dolichospermum TaxID=2622029 RepID=UPI0014464EED|nr:MULTISPECIES: restriction endonuclease subunit S [unclassified Dolichospermum]MEA5529228.1 restriction endonuclease subunit S [Dolichospermum sp. UHCC 0684]MTJ35339.1 restriction endonuclease subunit S [Dolichospermum sp. UHCC 0260]
MKGYLKYKDSGVQWLGEIPEHWDITKIKRLVSIKIADGPHETPIFSDTGYPFISAEAIQNNKIDFNRRRGNIKEELHTFYCKKCKPKQDDVLMCKSGSTTGKVAIVDTDIEFSIWSPLALIRSNQKIIIPKFLFYSMLEQSFQAQVQLSWSFGTQPNIGMGVIENLYLRLPTISEQKQIVYFLDHKLEQINHFISNKQRLIELLKEQKTAIINRAVTKGINPHAPMKPSGIEWLGEIPEHWKLKKLKWFTKTESGSTPNSGQQKKYYENGNINWVRTLDLNNDEIWNTEIKITEKAIVDTSCKIVPPGTVMIAMYGGDGTIGKNAILRVFAATNQAVCCILPNSNFVPEFLHKYVQFYRPHWMFDATGSRKDPNISQEIVRELIVFFPPIEEQKAIVSFIDEKSEKIDLAITKIEKEIELIKEYRTTLISDAVTGKIDVRI